MKPSIQSKKIVQNHWFVIFPVVLAVLSLLLVFCEDVAHFSPVPKVSPIMTEGQKEMMKRTETIREVLSQGKLVLTPGRYYRKLQELRS